MTIFWSVLATWLVLGGCAALIEEIDAEWPKYILLAPYIAVITPTAFLIKHIRATYIRSHYNIYRFGKNKNYKVILNLIFFFKINNKVNNQRNLLEFFIYYIPRFF